MNTKIQKYVNTIMDGLQEHLLKFMTNIIKLTKI